MSRYRLQLFLLLLFSLSCQPKDPYQVVNYLSAEEADFVIEQSVRYSAKLPRGGTQETKFDSKFDEYYQQVAKEEYDFRRCYRSSDNEYFFLMTRKARSIWPARESIGGSLKVDSNNKLLDYIEIFRTWKMTEDTLNVRSFELFDLMVNGKDLMPYRSKYKGDRYIEFPDDFNSWNVKEKKWIYSAMDSIR
jgi:hypothetical protein